MTWVAVGLATAGLALLSLQGLAVGRGEALTLVAAILYAGHIVALGRWSTPRTAVGLATVQAGVITLVAVVAAVPDGLTLPADAGQWASLLYMALVAGALALWAQTWAQAHLTATRAAIEEGIVPGGGSAIIHAVSVLDDELGLTGDEAIGVRVVRKAADEPLRWIAENGGENGYVVVSKVREGKAGEGFNAATGEYGDLVSQGVLDPVKVTRSALVNAASIAGMLLTTETLVVEKPEDEDAAPAGAGHGHGHGH